MPPSLNSSGPGVEIMLFDASNFLDPDWLLFTYGMRFAVQEMDEVWGPDQAGISYLVFPFLTYYYFNESMFNPKTLTCIMLSFVIVAIQVFWE